MKQPLIVQKFGGTSLGSIEKIRQVANHIIHAKNAGNHMVVVVSAMAGETDRLIDLAKKIDHIPTARELDALLAAGEQMSMALLAMTLNKLGYPAHSLTGTQAQIITDEQYNNASILKIDRSIIDELLAKNLIVIIAGFQGVTKNGDITTLGRGGSDTTAVNLASSLNANECQIFTDVDGIYTCDPRIVPNAQKLPEVNFTAMEAMASKGAKVLHPPSVQLASKKNIALRVLSTFDRDLNYNSGSLVNKTMSNDPVTGIAILRDLAMLEVSSKSLNTIVQLCQMLSIDIVDIVIDIKNQNLGILSGAIAKKLINIQQNNITKVGILIKQESWLKLKLIFNEQILKNTVVSLLTIIGSQANKLIFDAIELLAQHKIAVNFYSTNALTMSVILASETVEHAANILHDAYIIDEKFTNFVKNSIFATDYIKR